MNPSDEPLASHPLPDLVGGRYRIVSRLGVGGMGVVYKATDIQLHRSVAVKALEERRLHLPGAAMRLKTEALAAASLDHPYICKVYELVETARDTFIVMEFVEGETLSSILKRGALPLMQTLQLGREIAEGLANAHARGLVHRDVKPSNVMVTTHGHVKVLDFGVAGVDVESTPADATRTLAPQLTVHAGTPQYMAPEQAAGQPITTRADLFSLGVLLYECLTGQLPFAGSTTFDYVRHVLQSAPRRLDKVAPDTPADLVDLIDRMLEKQPADRPESAEAVVARLRQLEDAMTAPTGGIQTARQARAGRRWKKIAFAVIVVASIALTWRFVWPRSSPIDVPRQLRPFVTTSAIESGSRVSPDGQWVSYIATAGGASRIMVQRTDGGDARPLTLGPGTPLDQAWSPDGSQIAAIMLLDGRRVLQIYPAFFGGEPAQTVPLDTVIFADLIRWIGRDVYVIADVRVEASPTGQARVLRRISLDAPSDSADLSAGWKVEGALRGADVRPDGRAAVINISAGGHEDLWTVNLDGSNLTRLTADAYFDRDPIWVGAGDAVAFQSNRGGQVDIWIVDVRTKALTPLTSSEASETPESSSGDGRTISLAQRTQTANLWAFTADGARQLTQDSLSDYSPEVSADGQVLAFQRSRPTPDEGYTILDAKILVAPFQTASPIEARPVDDGFAPDLSRDGRWLAYLQRASDPARMQLSVRDLRGGATTRVSAAAGLPSMSSRPPVDWSSRTTGWSADGGLYFVDHSERYAIRRFDTAKSEAGPAFVTAPDKAYIREIYVSPESGRLAYVLVEAAPEPTTTVFELDAANNSRKLASFDREHRGVSLHVRSWFDGRVVIIRNVRLHENLSTDAEVLLADGRGAPRLAGRLTNVFPATIRLHAVERRLYMTRAIDGTDNIWAFAFDTGALTPVTQNTLPGVTFSGFQPTGAAGVLGAREERRDDIWLIQQGSTPRSGNPAGR